MNRTNRAITLGFIVIKPNLPGVTTPNNYCAFCIWLILEVEAYCVLMIVFMIHDTTRVMMQLIN